MANHVPADFRAGLFNLGNTEVGDKTVYRIADHIGLAAVPLADRAEPAFEFVVGRQKGPEKVFRPGENVMLALVPSL